MESIAPREILLLPRSVTGRNVIFLVQLTFNGYLAKNCAVSWSTASASNGIFMYSCTGREACK